jgi:hypothetical protein
MAYRTPKNWKPKDPYTPLDFNQYVKANFEYLAFREADDLILPSGEAANPSTTSTTLVIHPEEEIISVVVDKPSMVLFLLQTTFRITTTAGRLATYDILDLNDETFLSSGINTPLGAGLGWQETYVANERISYSAHFWLDDVKPGAHNYQLYIRVNADTFVEERIDARFAWAAVVI